MSARVELFDLLDDGALAGIPALMGATAGTARHALALEHALRPLFAAVAPFERLLGGG